MTTVAEVTTIKYSGVPEIDALLNQAGGWNYLLPERTTLYYTFSLGAIAGQAPSATTAFNADQKAAAAAILAYVSSITGILFSETASASSADIHFAACDLVGASTAGLCSTRSNYSYSGSNVVTYTLDAYVFLDNVEHSGINTTPTSGSSGYEVLLHEIGHALGLGHPFDDPGAADDDHILPANQDNTGNTVMSYTHVGGNKSTFQAYDLMALSWLYGQDGLRGAAGLNPSSGPQPQQDDFAANVQTAGSVSIGGTSTGQIGTAGDHDWFAVALVGGNTYAFDLLGASSAAGTLADPTLVLRTAAGAVLASNDNRSAGATESYIPFTAPSTGIYYLDVASAQAQGTGTYRVAATLLSANRAPVATNDVFTGQEDVAVTGNLLANDTDADGQALTATLGSGPSHGSVTLQPNGQFVYTPQANFAGTDSFIYTLSDGFATSSGAVSITLQPVNDAPVATTATRLGTEDVAIAGTLTAQDPDSAALTYAIVREPQHGTVVLNGNGFVYTPAANYNGTDNFTFRASDGTLLSNIATVNIVLTAVNDKPVAADLQVTLSEDTVKTGQLPLATDPDNDAVTYAKASNPAHGTANVTAAGLYTYTPQADYVGEDSFTYRVSDAKGGVSTHTVRLNVVNVQEALVGTPGPDVLVDVSGDALLQGLGGNDRLQGGSGNDTIEGGDGIDTAVYAGPRERYVVTTTAQGLRVVDSLQAEGTDQLSGVERLAFADGKLAFDLGDNAGEAAKLIGAAIGPGALQNKGLVGIALAYFDAGPTLLQSAHMLIDTGLMASFAGGADNRTFAEAVWRNATGTEASPETSQALQAILDQGLWSQAQMLYFAMEMPQNHERIGLVGLAESGLAYL